MKLYVSPQMVPMVGDGVRYGGVAYVVVGRTFCYEVAEVREQGPYGYMPVAYEHKAVVELDLRVPGPECTP